MTNNFLNEAPEQGCEMYELAVELFPLCRSITGDGVRASMSILKRELPDLVIHEMPSGTNCFDWTIPDEWNVHDAYISRLDGTRVVDFRDLNLHVVGYSEAFDGIVSRAELEGHLHSRKDMPDAVPYVTSYYRRSWGFCVSHNQRSLLTDDAYRVKIDATLVPGSLTYADLVIRGASEDEILISTYTCHPSMANNETSGMVVATRLAKFVQSMQNRHYTYRFVFIPETVGAIAYLSQHMATLKSRVAAGFVITCVGDDRAFSFLPSRKGATLADRIAKHVLERVLSVPYEAYSFLDRGSDERQYRAPGVGLPVVSIMRSKYGTYPEYHTSRDDLSLISPEGLYGGYMANQLCLEALEANETVTATVTCEPFLSPRGLRPPLVDGVNLQSWSKLLSDVLAYADGEMDLLAMADLFDIPIFELTQVVRTLKEHGLLTSDRRA